ncbi:MAG: hypothetical protein ACOC6K_00670 [Thermodesulfobacteriota bacterium]
MNIEEMMKDHGFNLSASCAGKASYTKWIKYRGKRAYITINDAGGDNLPTSLDEPVRVQVHDLKSGNELEEQEVSSLGIYLESLQG